jgi:DNA-binding phage protein
MPRGRETLLDPHPEYIADLKSRVEAGPGVTAVAKAAGLTRTTIWRLFNGGGDRSRPTIEAAERVRRALVELQPSAAAIPPAAIAIADEIEFRWLEAGRAYRKRDPEGFEKLLAELMAGKKRSRR